jgi:hypothetical protein
MSVRVTDWSLQLNTLSHRLSLSRGNICLLSITGASNCTNMSPLIQLLIPYSVSTEHLKIKLAHDKIISDKLSTVEIETITFLRI